MGSRARIVALLVTSLLIGVPMAGAGLPLIAPQPAVAATARVGAFGTAVIDGVASPGEWAAAQTLLLDPPLPPPMAGGAPAGTATVSLMNDARNLYVGVRVAGVYGRLAVRMEFGNDRDSDFWERGDDRLTVALPASITTAATLPLDDRFVGYCPTGSVGQLCDLSDSAVGNGNPPAGRVDGTAAGAFDLVSGYLEFSHPLSSGDAGHDVRLTPGDVVGFDLDITVVAPGCTIGACGSSVHVPAQRCSGSSCWTPAGGDLVIAAARASIATAAQVQDAIRLEAVTVTPALALAGTTLQVTYRLVNRSEVNLVMPMSADGRYAVLQLTETNGRLGPDAMIGARWRPDGFGYVLRPAGANPVDVGEPLDVLRSLGGTVWPAGAAISLSTAVRTDGHPPGDYRYRVEVRRLDRNATVYRSVTVPFTLKGVRYEWTAVMGSGGANGSATVRGYTTGDEALVLALRSLVAGASYPVAIVRGTCAAPVTVASIGTVTTSVRGSVARTLGIGASRVTAVRAAAAPGPILVRVGTGSRARCGRLAAVPLFAGSVAWSVARLPTDGYTGTSAVRGVTAGGPGFVAIGTDRGPTGPTLCTWTSRDGSSWERHVLMSGTSGMPVIASSGPRMVIVDGARAWWSTDGLAWTPASGAPPATPFGTRLLGTPYGFVALTWADRGDGTFDTVAHFSADGSGWLARPPDPELEGFGPTSMTYGPAGIMAIGVAAGRAVLMRSDDLGISWARIPVPASLATGAISGAKVASVGNGFVVFASLARASGVQRCGEWYSPNAWDWRYVSSFVPPGGWPYWSYPCVTDVVKLGTGYVALATANFDVGDEWATAFTSGDGRTWKYAPWLPARGASIIGAATIGDSAVIVGYSATIGGDENPRAWQAVAAPGP